MSRKNQMFAWITIIAVGVLLAFCIASLFDEVATCKTINKDLIICK